MVAALTVAWVSGGCSGKAVTSEAAGPPPIPLRTGPLTIDVVYPRDSAFISSRDSSFIFGSVGNGNAELTINGQAVTVEQNGAFLAWLQVPATPGDTLAHYDLRASLAGQQVRAVRTVRLRAIDAPLPDDVMEIDTASIAPSGAWWARSGEIVPIRVRASPATRVRLLLPGGELIRLSEAPESQGSGIYEGELVVESPLGRGLLSPRLQPIPAALRGAVYCEAPALFEIDEAVADTSVDFLAPTGSRDTDEHVADSASAATIIAIPSECAVLEVASTTDTLRAPLPFDLWVLDGPGPAVELRETPSAVGRDGFVIGRAAPGGTTLWMWIEGVRARVTGRRGDSVRIRLDEATEAWIALDEVVWLPGAGLAERARVGNVSIAPLPDRLRVRVGLSTPIPYAVEEENRRFSLVLYGAYSGTDRVYYGAGDTFLQRAGWEQQSTDRYALHLDLSARPWGYRVRREAGALVVEIRKPPIVEADQPFAGLTIALDPGHPPAGSIGPTRLYEGDANLAIAFRVRELLERQGAEVLMTRTDRSPVRIYDRTWRAELFDADLLISIHNNALPDGVNPFESNGTSVFYFHPSSLDLAAALQRSLLAALGLNDLGIGRASLALARPTWMPAALTEGAFMMIPEQEAALRDPDFLDAYAEGIVEGLRAFVLGRLEGGKSDN